MLLAAHRTSRCREAAPVVGMQSLSLVAHCGRLRRGCELMIIWTDYLRYRAELRGFDLEEVEKVLRFSTERYLDRTTGRRIIVGRHGDSLVLVPFDVVGEDLVPVTVHRTSRQQIHARLKSGRYIHE